MYLEHASFTSISNTTVSDNSSKQLGGGIFAEGTADRSPSALLSLANSSVVGNNAPNDTVNDSSN